MHFREKSKLKKTHGRKTKQCNLRGGTTRGRTRLTFMWEAALWLSAGREEKKV